MPVSSSIHQQDSVLDISAQVDPQQFREAMSHVPAAVFIVTTDGLAGRSGMTATSVTSVSTEPPLMSVCINRTSSSLSRFIDNGCFAINLLAPKDQLLSDVFSGRTGQSSEDRFSEGRWAGLRTGAPILESAVVGLDCRLVNTTALATHMVLVGVVEAIKPPIGSEALLYRQRQYIFV